jgi:hypothetical protein
MCLTIDLRDGMINALAGRSISDWEVEMKPRYLCRVPGLSMVLLGIAVVMLSASLALPALRPGQPIGRAPGSEIDAAIRDSGAFLDPRSRKDWWQGR